MVLYTKIVMTDARFYHKVFDANKDISRKVTLRNINLYIYGALYTCILVRWNF